MLCKLSFSGSGLTFDKQRLLDQIARRQQSKAAFLRVPTHDPHMPPQEQGGGALAADEASNGSTELAVGGLRRRGMAGHVISYRAQYLREERAAYAQEMEAAAQLIDDKSFDGARRRASREEEENHRYGRKHPERDAARVTTTRRVSYYLR